MRSKPPLLLGNGDVTNAPAIYSHFTIISFLFVAFRIFYSLVFFFFAHLTPLALAQLCRRAELGASS